MSYFSELNQQFALGIDISRYNTSADGRQPVNFDVIAAHVPRVAFIAMRSGASWGYEDPCYRSYALACQRVNICQIAYHVLYPGESAQRQVDNLMKIISFQQLAHVRLCLDLELDHGYQPDKITNTLLCALNLLKAETGRYPIVYSRAGWVNQFLRVQLLPPELDWWLAQYRYRLAYPAFTSEHPCPPRLPAGVNRWLIHQTAERAPGIGMPAAHYMDVDRWHGSLNDVRRYFGYQPLLNPVVCPLDNIPCQVKSYAG